MSNKNDKPEVMRTPVGIAVWPKLSGEPDTKFSKDGHGVWKTTMRFKRGDPGVDEFLAVLEQRHAAAISDDGVLEQYKEYCVNTKKNGKKPAALLAATAPWTDEIGEDEKETGNVLINFKMKASGVSKKTKKPWKRKPMLFDAKGVEITKDINVGGGSKLKISFELSTFWTAKVGAGISLRMEGVQILDLKTFQKKTAAQLGFGVEEGYEFDTSADEDTAEPDAGVEAGGGGDGTADFE